MNVEFNVLCKDMGMNTQIWPKPWFAKKANRAPPNTIQAPQTNAKNLPFLVTLQHENPLLSHRFWSNRLRLRKKNIFQPFRKFNFPPRILCGGPAHENWQRFRCPTPTRSLHQILICDSSSTHSTAFFSNSRI